MPSSTPSPLLRNIDSFIIGVVFDYLDGQTDPKRDDLVGRLSEQERASLKEEITKRMSPQIKVKLP